MTGKPKLKKLVKVGGTKRNLRTGIPVHMADMLGIKVGDHVVHCLKDDHIVVRKATAEDLKDGE